MKNTVVGLMKRDVCILLHLKKRLLAYCGSVFLLDVILWLYSQKYMMKQEVVGVTVNNFLSNPDKMPLQWIWNQVGIILIAIDFIRRDLCQHTSCFFPHIQKRSWYWYSKLICGSVLAFFLALFQLLEKSIIAFLCYKTFYSVEIHIVTVLRFGIFLFLGTCTLYWLYALISLLMNEVIGLVLCLAYVFVGLFFDTPLLYCNNFMLVRGSFLEAVITTGIMLIVCTIAGAVKIENMDILSD